MREFRIMSFKGLEREITTATDIKCFWAEYRSGDHRIQQTLYKWVRRGSVSLKEQGVSLQDISVFLVFLARCRFCEGRFGL